MNRYSYFIKDKAIFGGYPSPSDIEYYERLGVIYFIDLTDTGELEPYIHNGTYLKHCINDMDVPSYPVEFSRFVVSVVDIINSLKEGELLFASCKGGHGRVGILVSCVLSLYHGISPTEALQLTNNYHSNRIEMKKKWRDIGSPQTYKQKNFVIKLFTPFCFSRNVKTGDKAGFNPHSCHSITIGDMVFDTSQKAFDSLVGANDDVNQQIALMERIMTLKMKQHPDVLKNIMSTNLRPIIYCSLKDRFWGISKIGEGENQLGQLLMRLRLHEMST